MLQVPERARIPAVNRKPANGNVQRLLAALNSSKEMKCLEVTRKLHADAAESGVESNIYIASKLVELYSQCGSMSEAKSVFDKVEQPDVVLWNVLILGYVGNGEADVGLELFFNSMQGVRGGCSPNSRTLVAALKACGYLAEREPGVRVDGSTKLFKVKSLENGKCIHAIAEENNWEHNSYVANTLIDMYSRCGSLGDAKQVFDSFRHRDTVSWNILMLGYVENGETLAALELLPLMLAEERCEPNSRTCVAALKACSCLSAEEVARKVDGKMVKMNSLERVMAVHSLASVTGLEPNIFIGNTLMDAYAKCGRMTEAREVFSRLTQPDVVSWNVIMLGYAENGGAEEALHLFSRMQAEGRCVADARSFVAVLKACSALAEDEPDVEMDGKLVKAVALEQGMAFHSLASKSGCSDDIFVCCSLIDMYSNCGSVSDSKRVYDGMKQLNVVCRNALMLGYADNEEPELALELFVEVMQETPELADCRTFLAALKACAALAGKETLLDKNQAVKMISLERGMSVHQQAARKPSELDIFVSSSLVDMYAKCGDMPDSRLVFDSMPWHGLVSWNSLILGYAENGQPKAALDVFLTMQREEQQYDERTLVAVFKACGNMTALRAGKEIHASVCSKRGELQSLPQVVTALIDFYGKSGSMVDAQHVFDSAAAIDTVGWTSLLAGYSHLGDADLVLGLFQEMLSQGLQPDGITFLSVLNACGGAGEVDKARDYFRLMTSSRYRVAPQLEHYHCMTDMLGRVNRLEEAVEMVKSMPFQANVVTWTSLLASCTKWKNVKIGKLAFQAVVALDDKLGSAYILMAEIYESLGMKEDESNVLSMQRHPQAKQK